MAQKMLIRTILQAVPLILTTYTDSICQMYIVARFEWNVNAVCAWQGVWKASYGPHGNEVVLVTFKQGSAMFRGSHPGKLEGLKVPEFI